MDGEVRSALTYPSLLKWSALRPTADVKVRAQLAPGEPLCTREWGICSHLEQAGESGLVRSTAGCTKQSQHIKPTNGNTKKFLALCKYLAGCFEGVPTWQAHPKMSWHPPQLPTLTTPAPGNPFGSAGSPAVLAAGRAGDLGMWDALCLGTRSRAPGPGSPPQHYVMSLSSQRCPGLHVGA